MVAAVFGETWEDIPRESVAVTLIRADAHLRLMVPFWGKEIAIGHGVGAGGHKGHGLGPGVSHGVVLAYTRWIVEGPEVRAPVDGRAGVYGTEGSDYSEIALEASPGYIWTL